MTWSPAATGKLLTEIFVQIIQFSAKRQKHVVQFSKTGGVIFFNQLKAE